MNYYNQNSNPLNQQIFGGAPTKQMPQMSEEQLFSFTSTLNKSAWQKLVSQARARGISDEDIQAGLSILLQHR